MAKSPAWQRKAGKSPSGGLNERGRRSYERENPGSDLKPPQPQGGKRKNNLKRLLCLQKSLLNID